MMEHIDEILSSDLLERYVLGDVSPEEKMKVELLRIEHTAIREELERLELAIEKMAIDNAIVAPAATRECIIKSMGNKPVASPSSTTIFFASSWWKIAAAFLVGSLGTWALTQQQINVRDNALAQQQEQYTRLSNDCELLNQQYAFINHTSTIPVLLEGTQLASESQVVVYWNEELKHSLLRVIELPSIDANQTYQLWADVEGQMLSLGIFDAGEAITDAIPMNFLANATSLNITVEPKGGSEHPTVSTLTASQVI